MTAEELRSLADTLEQCSPFRDSASVYQAANYLRACADALEAGPVAKVYAVTLTGASRPSYMDVRFFSNRPFQDGQLLYPLAMPAPLRLPEPLTDKEVDALIDETEHLPTDLAVRYLVETGERRVKDVNE